MPRLLAIILAFAALIVQIGMGSFPAGEVCLCTAAPASETGCCCDDECNSPVSPERRCPCEPGCEHCVRVPVGEQRITLAARLQPRQVQVVVVTPMDFGLAAPSPARAAFTFGPVPRIDGSPPHIGPMCTVRLTI